MWSGKAWVRLGKEQRNSVVVDDAGVLRRRGAEAAAGQSIANEGLAWVVGSWCSGRGTVTRPVAVAGAGAVGVEAGVA